MLRRITATISLVSLVAVSLLPLTTFAAPRNQGQAEPHAQKKLAPEFNSTGNSTATVRALIQTKGAPSSAHDAAVANARGHKRSSYNALNMIVADVPLNSIAELAARDDVAYVSPDRLVKAEINLTTESTGASQVQAGFAGMPGFDGKGVTIAVLDSGISGNHPDFVRNGTSRVIAAVDFSGSAKAGDAEGHGTGVASMAAGSGAASSGYEGNYAGIAPGASLLDVRVLDEQGVGRTSNLLAAINWVIENQKQYNIGVVNMSMGTPVRESFHVDPICKAVEAAVRAGIVVVCSAGNQGRTEEIVGHNSDGSPIYQLAYGTVSSPGNSPYAITVGAIDTHSTVRRSDDTVAAFSSKGPTRFDHLAKPELVAPGRRVIAAMSQEPNSNLATQYPDRVIQPVSSNAAPYKYFNYSGTSFAAPIVAGTVALMLEANRSLSPLLAKAVLLRTAQMLPGYSSKPQSLVSQGAGEVNVAAAVEMARAIVPNAQHLKAGDHIFGGNETLDSLSKSFSFGGQTVAASSRVLYADGVLFVNQPGRLFKNS